MKFSRKARYGLRAMVALAQNYPGEPVSLNEIAKSEEISLGYLEQLMAILRKAGLVEGTRGAQGGYKLKGNPATITVGRVLRVLDGPLAPAECASDGASPLYCSREGVCTSKQLWRRVHDSLSRVLDTMTLADLCHNRHIAEEKN